MYKTQDQHEQQQHLRIPTQYLFQSFLQPSHDLDHNVQHLEYKLLVGRHLLVPSEYEIAHNICHEGIKLSIDAGRRGSEGRWSRIPGVGEKVREEDAVVDWPS